MMIVFKNSKSVFHCDECMLDVSRVISIGGGGGVELCLTCISEAQKRLRATTKSPKMPKKEPA